jgi:hypothetical protein
VNESVRLKTHFKWNNGRRRVRIKLAVYSGFWSCYKIAALNTTCILGQIVASDKPVFGLELHIGRSDARIEIKAD